MRPSQIFISHVEEDEPIARDLAQGLEEAGYGTWYYERDSAPGPSYLIQTHDAIIAAGAVVLLVSADTLSRPHQVTPEVVRAHESHKPIVPLLIDVTDAEYKRRQPEWRQMIGSATSVAVPDAGVSAIMPRVLRGLQALGVMPAAGGIVPARRPAPGWPARAIVAGAIAGFMVLGTTVNVTRAINPTPGGDEFNLYMGFPAVRIANVFGNGVNGVLAVMMLLTLWQRRADSGKRVRTAAVSILGVTLVWLVWVLAATVGGANWRLVTPADQSRLIVSTITIGVLSLVLPAVIYVLYRRPGRE
jgi:hypothetical protein